jgi:hypothetical protein
MILTGRLWGLDLAYVLAGSTVGTIAMWALQPGETLTTTPKL